ncbi:hypothetical protein LRD18_09015 [Halorhodospira halochloris]|uniref:hypothetical protein n=1 Tax=Halorhodospira halochloris TaxID=1052 RepID=UPI001EE83A1D|nr:hypothetical protein [Halorhodospira halochloris]MCG5531011.1 hypothetical protein [Halorhodospira halochloris]
MNANNLTNVDPSKFLEPFPENAFDSGQKQQTNNAVLIYGLRYYKDQTPIEYLSEFLLVFSSPKNQQNKHSNSFVLTTESRETPCYWPKNLLALKLFAFFPFSKLETRHSIHRSAYLKSIDKLQSCICDSASLQQKEEAVRLIQSLLGGFVGVAKNRTWATYSFLPASTNLLGRELDWLHSRARRSQDLCKWDDAKEYFAHDRHNFMARGGELLFLQLANLFNNHNAESLRYLSNHDNYKHLSRYGSLQELQQNLEHNLKSIIDDSIKPLNSLVSFIEEQLDDFNLDINNPARLGWVPKYTATEAILFASEIDNICRLSLSPLEKLDHLKTLCCLHVLRSLCFQANRIDQQKTKTVGFVGNYAWIPCNPKAPPAANQRKIAQNSFSRIERILYRVLHMHELFGKKQTGSMNEAINHGHKIFHKLSKEMEIVIPKKGSGERFSFNTEHIRFMVAALVQPDERIRLDDFYNRVFAHYGIALGGEPLATALSWLGGGISDKTYGVDINTDWVEEALQQGGYLIELSDAVSIVHNPGREA